MILIDDTQSRLSGNIFRVSVSTKTSYQADKVINPTEIQFIYSTKQQGTSKSSKDSSPANAQMGTQK